MQSCINNNRKILFLLLNTGSIDSSGIFDYSNVSGNKLKAYILNSIYIVRTKFNVYLNIEQHADIDTDNGEELLFYVKNSKQDNFSLINPLPVNLKPTDENFIYLNNKMWYILNSEGQENNLNCNEDYYLNENDIIKLGKIKYIVQKIHLLPKYDNINNSAAPPKPVFELEYNISDKNKNTKPVFNMTYLVKYYKNYININEKIQDNQNNEEENITKCKFCDNKFINPETDNGENFLISICKCKELYHFNCLKNYFKLLMEQDKKDENSFVQSYIFKNFECSKCKSSYPTKIKLKGFDETFSLVDFILPENSNYLYLESIDYKVNNSNYKSIHIVKLTKKNKTIRIGRVDDNDIVDRDISMSRHHAILFFDEENGKICIKNISQKFGTLVLVKNRINILNKKIYLQIGRTYVEASLMDREEYEKLKIEMKNKIFENIDNNDKLNDNNDKLNNNNQRLSDKSDKWKYFYKNV